MRDASLIMRRRAIVQIWPWVAVSAAVLCRCFQVNFVQLLTSRHRVGAAARWNLASPGRRLMLLRSVESMADTMDRVGSFELLEVLGDGQQGVRTYRARCVDTFEGVEVGEDVALKLVSLRGKGGWKPIVSIEREAKTLARLRHPGIPNFLGAFEVDTESNRGYALVQRIAPGRSLRALMEAPEPFALSPPQLRKVAESLLEVCAYLASRAPPVVHRDISPGNVVLEGWQKGVDSLQVKLVDFGAAVLSTAATGVDATTASGTFGFMAPESFGKQATPLSDLYSVGATLLYIATGRDPGELPRARLRVDYREALQGTVWSKEVWFLQLLDALLQPSPEDRPQSAEEAMQILRGGGMARSSGKQALPASTKLEISRSGSELTVFFPPPGTADRIATGAFATAWTGFTAYWTFGVLAAGAPIMALFSAPFWLSGGKLLKDAFSKGGSVFQLGQDRWGLIEGENLIDEGSTEDLARAEVVYVRSPESGVERGSIVLRGASLGSGIKLPSSGLSKSELAGLATEINAHLKRLRPWLQLP